MIYKKLGQFIIKCNTRFYQRLNIYVYFKRNNFMYLIFDTMSNVRKNSYFSLPPIKVREVGKKFVPKLQTFPVADSN